MRYVRFLKPPRLQNDKLTALITITSDLGESFLQEECLVLFSLQVADGIFLRCPNRCLWGPGQRVLHFEVDLSQFSLVHWEWPLKLFATTLKELGGDGGDGHGQPVFGLHPDLGMVGAWSDIVDPTAMPPVLQASRHLLRRFVLTNGSTLRIWEETGESIARHIWDAGLAFVNYLNETINQHEATPVNVDQPQQTSRDLSVLELGCGCGLVGISLAQLVPSCTVLLTDLPEAQAIAERNIHAMTPALDSSATFKCLQWEDKELREPFTSTHFDLVLVSDCTYNPDSSPALVRTLATVALLSPGTVVLVAMKVRHEAEECFFTLMKHAGFLLQKHTLIPLPKVEEYMNPEFVEIYVFYHGDGGTRPCRNPSQSPYTVQVYHQDKAAAPGASIPLWTDAKNKLVPRWAASGMPLAQLWRDTKHWDNVR